MKIEMTYKINRFRYANEFRQTRLFFAGGGWGRNKTLVVFSDRTFVPFVMGEGDFIVGNRRVR